MFGFILGFILGGVTGAGIVLALSPEYQYQGEGAEEMEGDATAGGQASELQAKVKTRVKKAVAEGKKAAAEKTAEMKEQVSKQRGARRKAKA